MSQDTQNLRIEYIEKNSQGVPAKPGQLVTVHYTGWLDEQGQKGKKFDSSKDRGKPFSFSLGMGHVIRGWDEGLKDVPVGSSVILYIPSSMAYGERGAGGDIPPNANLIFEVDVLKAE